MAVSRALSPRRVMFKTFVWTGLFRGRYNNTNAVRRDAAKHLEDVLYALHEQWPAVPVFIVAHSHGGNVALYAAQDLGTAVPLAGIVSMGTPFLKVQPLRLREDTALVTSIEGVAFICWLVLLGLSALAGMGVLALGFKIGLRSGVLYKLVALPFVLVGLVLVSWMVRVDKKHPYRLVQVEGHLERRLRFTDSEASERLRKTLMRLSVDTLLSWARTRQDELARLSSVLPPNVPMLVLWSKQDEVLVGLPLQDKFTTSTVGFLSSPRTATVALTLGMLACAIAAAVWGGRTFVEALRYGGRTGSDWLVALLVGALEAWFVFVLGIFLGVLTLIVVTPFSVLVRAPLATPSLVAYGTLDFTSAYLTETRAMTTPIQAADGSSSLTEMPPYEFSQGGGLVHSQYYSNDVSIAAIGSWMAARLRPEER